ncbi:MAG: hypothetical protein HS116_11105 [Planctomycetes bacterium]|nr:hypothetical protein [Planctomycetota bacterium]
MSNATESRILALPTHPRAIEAAPMVMYEWKMLRAAYKMLTILRKSDDPRREQLFGVLNEGYSSALFLNSFLFHARNLADFLYTRGGEDADAVLAEHFFANPEDWRRKDLNPGPFLTANKTRLYQQLSRPRYARIAYGRLSVNNWDLDAIWNDLSGAWQTFWTALPISTQEYFEVVPEEMPMPKL